MPSAQKNLIAMQCPTHSQPPKLYVSYYLYRMQVLFSRWLGQLKQGWLHGDNYTWVDSPDVHSLLQETPQLNAPQFEPANHKFATISFA